MSQLKNMKTKIKSLEKYENEICILTKKKLFLR